MSKIIFYLYIVFLLVFLFFSYAFIDPNLLYLHKIYSGFAFDNRVATSLLYLILILIFYIFYGILINYFGKKNATKNNFKKYFIATICILIFSYPAMLSYDIFNYMATAKVAFLYKENPYIIMPIELIGDPLLLFMHAANKVALYGPIWILFTGLPYIVSFGNFLVFLFSLKMFVCIFYIASVYLIWKLSDNLLSVVFFALNPLVIIEILISGHNDIVMMFLALLAFYFFNKKKTLVAIFLLFLSILIKYATIFLLPIFIYIVWKNRFQTKIDWGKIYFYSTLSMIIIFLLSPIREELYSWYAIWFLTFASLCVTQKIVYYFSIFISFGLLLRYLPFMFLGTYFGSTPTLKTILTMTPLVIGGLWFLFKEKIWQKKSYQS